jgi:enediyne biosynthesis protein E4
LSKPGFSNGSAYGDLDNDGDLDLVINNVNGLASIMRNESNNQLMNSYLKFELTGVGKNTFAWGTTITITKGDQVFYMEQMPNRGFESSMDPRPNIGLGKTDTVDLVLVLWPDGKETRMQKVATNQVLKLNQQDGKLLLAPEPLSNKIFQSVNLSGIDYTHKESNFIDFDRDKLLFHMLSTEGPKMAKADVNNDGLEDLFIGGAKDEAASLFIQTKDRKFLKQNQLLFDKDKESEDIMSVFFDADNDGDIDLYVCSGSNEFSTSSIALADRLYINDGKGNFSKSAQILPTFTFESTSTVKPFDYDKDGDMDLFVGVRSHPFLYGIPMNGYILNNDGKGKFKNVTLEIAKGLEEIGMITDAAWSDINGDGNGDLIVVGEYMPITVFVNESGSFVNKTEQFELNKTNGWWNTIESADLDGDGDLDFVLGNHGLNSRFKASEDKPVCMYVNDFDKNGTMEQIICTYYGDKSYPMVLRHDLMAQIPTLKKKYLKYESFKDQMITDIFTQEELSNAIKHNVYELSNSLLINEGAEGLKLKHLPVEAQFSVTYAIIIDDFDHDGSMDIILAGNLYNVKPEVGQYDASYGTFLKGDGKGNFIVLPETKSGLMLDGEIRDLETITIAGKKYLLAARNNDSILTNKIN